MALIMNERNIGNKFIPQQAKIFYGIQFYKTDSKPTQNNQEGIYRYLYRLHRPSLNIYLTFPPHNSLEIWVGN